MINTARGVSCTVLVERMSDRQISMHLGGPQPSDGVEKDMQHSITILEEISPENGDSTVPSVEVIENKDENVEPTHKHGILHLLGESVPKDASPPKQQKKKRRKERESVEHLMVKQNQSSSFLPFDHTKRKTKKMAEMLDFLERERNVSLLNDICRSKFGGSRKKCKRTLSEKSSSFSQLAYPFSSVAVDLEVSSDMESLDSNNKPSKASDVSYFYPNLRSGEEETKSKDFSENDAESSHTSATSEESLLKTYSPLNEAINEEGEDTNDTMECDESPEKTLYHTAIIKNEIEIEDNACSPDEDIESPVLNLQISDVKGSACIDPEGYTSDESMLVIDEGFGIPVSEGGNNDSFTKKIKNLKHSARERETVIETLDEGQIQLQVKINPNGTSLKLEQAARSIVIDECSSNKSKKKSNTVELSPPHTPSVSQNDSAKVIKEKKHCQRSSNCYVIEVAEEIKKSKNSCSTYTSFVEDTPLIRKIKLKKVINKEDNACDAQDVSSSSSGSRTESEDIIVVNDFPTDHRLGKEEFIVDVENYKECQNEYLEPKKHNEIGNKLKLNSPPYHDSSEQVVSSSNLDSASSSNLDSVSSSNQSSSSSHQVRSQQNEFTVLRRHLESGDNSRRYSMPRDPRRNKTSFDKIEPDNTKAGRNDRNSYNDTQPSESSCFRPDPDILSQNPLGEFNEVIYVMYRELSTPLAQNLIGQLTEILYLVISESVRYSDRCKKAKRLVSPELVVREEVTAHRDFQANTIFYGMYFTHLFRNVVQCFPISKAFYTFMYLALFVKIFRRLKSIYNVHSSYLHIARKLVVSMLKANAYEDILMFSAICKPDSVFETDFVLVSQLIDSFSEYTKTLTDTDCYSHETNYSSQWHDDFSTSRKSLSQTPAVPNRNIIHPEFPSARISVVPMHIQPPKIVPKSQAHSINSQTKSRVKEDSHYQPKNPKLISSKDPRVFSYLPEQERRNSGMLRPPFFLVTGITDPSPMPQTMTTVCSGSSNPPSMATSIPKCIPASTPTYIPTSSPMHIPKPIIRSTPACTPTYIPTSTSMSTPTSSPLGSSSGGKAQAKTSATTMHSGQDQPQPSGIHIWRPTAIRPRFRTILPYYPQDPLFVSALTTPPHTFGDNCS